MARMKKTAKNAIMITIFLALIGLIIWLVVFVDKKMLVPDNPAGTVGNTGGNLNNEGLFCQDGNTVYFSNPLDNSVYTQWILTAVTRRRSFTCRPST